MKQKVNDELKKHFRPEFLNRIDDIIVFHQLTQDEIVEMVDLMIGRVGKQLKAKDMAMELTDKAKALLAKRGFDPVLGARPLRRTIQREIEDALSREDPVRRGRSGSDRHGRRRRTGTARDAGEDAMFTFAGRQKAVRVDRTWPGRAAGAPPRRRVTTAIRRTVTLGWPPSLRRSRWRFAGSVRRCSCNRRALESGEFQNGRATVKVRPDARHHPFSTGTRNPERNRI